MASTVLIVEDNPHTIELVRLYLGRDGHKVLAAVDGIEGLRLPREAQPDLVVLDLMLPGLDSMEICHVLRQESEVPIVMLTARVEEEDRLAGLELGADDYVTKPFSPRELAARVRDALGSGPAELSYGSVTVNMRQQTACVASEALRLTPTEFRLLALMVREPGRIFTREHIIDRVFGYDFDGFDRTVDAHVFNLRRKLETDSEGPSYVHTIYGVGYRFGDG